MKKYILFIVFLLCTNIQVYSERPCLWISLMQAGYLVSTITGGVLGYYFPSPLFEDHGYNATWVFGTIAGTTTYLTVLGVGATIKAHKDGACC